MRTHIIALIALVCTLASCGKKQEDPVKAAISNKISEQIGETSNIYFSSLALVDSTTFGEEIARRRNTLEIRRKQNLKLAGQYEAAGKVKNEAAKRADAANDLRHLEGLSAIESRLAANDSLDVVEAYIYKFSGSARTYKGTVNFTDMFVSITPQHEVVGMDYKKEGALKSAGRLIPGYSALFE